MSSRYSDPRIRERAQQLGGRVMHAIAEAKRAEAEARNAATPHEWTRAHREGRCWCPELGVMAGECPWPWKERFASRAEAAHRYSRLPPWRKTQGLRPYRCDTGDHYHLGRSYSRVSAAWRAA